jgi:hypothetical protein
MNMGLNVKDPELIYFRIYFYMRKSMEYAYGTVDDDQSRRMAGVDDGSATSKEAATREAAILECKREGGCGSIYRP